MFLEVQSIASNGRAVYRDFGEKIDALWWDDNLAMLTREYFKNRAFGWDGLTTFIFSNVLILGSLGITMLAAFVYNLRIACASRVDVRLYPVVLVPGLRLHQNKPAAEFIRRLERSLEYYRNAPQDSKPRIMILGGITADNSVSEARVGADYLLSKGVQESAIECEDQSRHTLENMQHARDLLGNQQGLVVTNRYHLARAVMLARGLGMKVSPFPAEEKCQPGAYFLYQVLRESYYVHWYFSGKLWVILTANRAAQSKIR